MDEKSNQQFTSRVSQEKTVITEEPYLYKRKIKTFDKVTR